LCSASLNPRSVFIVVEESRVVGTHSGDVERLLDGRRDPLKLLVLLVIKERLRRGCDVDIAGAQKVIALDAQLSGRQQSNTELPFLFFLALTFP
jgi:hypothetical protein